MTFSLRFRAAVVSIALFLAFMGIWHIATRGTSAVASMTPPTTTTKSFVVMGKTFDPSKPEDYLNSFKIRKAS